MIPKIIHYCWFGGNPLPELAVKCIESWKKNFPDYEIKEWNESNFDINVIPYTRDAYKEKKYAFVSDYARFWILYNYGGVYFDTDVEVIKSFDKILASGPFMGIERDPMFEGDNILVAPGLGLAVEEHNEIYKKVLDKYETLSYLDKEGNRIPITVCDIVTNLLLGYGLKNVKGIQKVSGISIYPSEYFNPINPISHRIHKTRNCHSVHWYMASWVELSLKQKIISAIRNLLPERVLLWYNKRKVLKQV